MADKIQEAVNELSPITVQSQSTRLAAVNPLTLGKPGAFLCPALAERGWAWRSPPGRRERLTYLLTQMLRPCSAGDFEPQPPQARKGRRVRDPIRCQFITARSGMFWRAHAAVLYAPVAEQADAPASKAASLCRFDSCLAHQYADTARRARVHNGHKRRCAHGRASSLQYRLHGVHAYTAG